MSEEQPIRIVEYHSNRTSLAKRKKLQERGLKLMHYPSGEHPIIIPAAAAINKESLFPEECLRIICKLLELASQKHGKDACVFQPIRTELLKHGPRVLSQTGCFQTIQNNRLIEAMHYFINWELFYYLTGKRDDNVIHIIEKKIKYYLNNQGERI